MWLVTGQRSDKRPATEQSSQWEEHLLAEFRCSVLWYCKPWWDQCWAHTLCNILPAETPDEAKKQRVTLSTFQAGPTPCLAKPFMRAWQSLGPKQRIITIVLVKPLLPFCPRGSPSGGQMVRPCCCWLALSRIRSRLDHWHAVNVSYSPHHTSSRVLCDVTWSTSGREIIAKQNYETWNGGFGRSQKLIWNAWYDTIWVTLKGWASTDSPPPPRDGAHPRPWAESCVQTWGKFELGPVLWS